MIDPGRIIVALDFSKKEDALRIVNQLEGLVNFYKIGLELFISEGPSIISLIKAKNKKIFLDLKLHDIPETVYKATKSALRYEIDMLTVHTTGGIDMMRRSAEALKEISLKENNQTKILGVTVLTSQDKKSLESLFNHSFDPETLACNLALKAKQAGLDGVIASGHEVRKIKEICGKNFMVVTPGIRLKKDEKNDQRRTVTPNEAFSAGADYIVIGRSLTQVSSPKDRFIEMFKN